MALSTLADDPDNAQVMRRNSRGFKILSQLSEREDANVLVRLYANETLRYIYRHTRFVLFSISIVVCVCVLRISRLLSAFLSLFLFVSVYMVVVFVIAVVGRTD